MAHPRPHDADLIARFSLSVTRLARMLRQHETMDLTPAAYSMVATIVRSGAVTLGELAEAERITPSTVTKLVSKLEVEGWIEREIDAADRRVHRVRLSEHGHREIAEYRAKRNAWIAEQLAPLSDDDHDRFVAAVEVLEHLTESMGRDPVAVAVEEGENGHYED